MGDEIREKWDRIYRERSAEQGHAVRVVAENLHLLPATGKGLELACGLASNSFTLAEHGIVMEAWDISPVAAERVNRRAAEAGAKVTACPRDVVADPPAAAEYDVVVVSHFLDRSLAPAIITALKPGGLLFYQTFTQIRVAESGPKTDEWRLAEGELLRLFAGLKPLVYREEGVAGDVSSGLRNEALLVAQKPHS